MTLKNSLPIALLAGTALLVHVNAEPKEGEKEAPKAIRVLLLTGGCCHDYDVQKELIPAGIGERANVDFTVLHEGGKGHQHQFELLKKDGWEKDFDVVFYNICFARETDVEYIDGITNTHKAGLPAVALHCTYHSHHWRAETDSWVRFIGVTSPNHGPHAPVKMTNVAPEHPVMKGFPETWVTPKDELYNVDKVWPTATVLANGDNGQRNQPCVWVNDFEGTRVFGTTIGHYNETIAEPIFMDLLTRGLLWSVGKLDDDGKPHPGYGRE